MNRSNLWKSNHEILGCRSQNCRARKAIRRHSWGHCRTSWWKYRQNRIRRKCKFHFLVLEQSFWETKRISNWNHQNYQSRIAVNYSQFIFTDLHLHHLVVILCVGVNRVIRRHVGYQCYLAHKSAGGITTRNWNPCSQISSIGSFKCSKKWVRKSSRWKLKT